MKVKRINIFKLQLEFIYSNTPTPRVTYYIFINNSKLGYLNKFIRQTITLNYKQLTLDLHL